MATAGTTETAHFDRTAFKVAGIYVTLAADGLTADFIFMPDKQALKCTTAATLGDLSTAELDSALDTAWARALPRPKTRRKPA